MINPIFQKLNFKNQPAIYVLDAPPSFAPALDQMRPLTEIRTALPKVASKPVDFALAFATTQRQVDLFADRIAATPAPDPIVWIAYPKGTSKNYSCEFNRDSGWQRLGHHGFEPVRQVAIDDDWSALRFRRVEHIKTMTRRSALSKAGEAKRSQKRPI